MLDYTIAAGKRVLRNIKLTSLVLNLIMQVLSTFYLIYILARGRGVLVINLGLLLLSCAYLVFYCFTVKNRNKVLKHRIKLVFKWSKRGIRLVNLGIVLYALLTAKDGNNLDTVLFLLSVGCWVLDLAVEIFAILARNWGMLLYEGLQADIEAITTPVTATKNFFKRLAGKEVEEKPEPTKRRLLLDELVENAKAEKKNAKLEKKAAKKAEKLAAKQAKKGIQSVHAPSVSEEVALSEDEK